MKTIFSLLIPIILHNWLVFRIREYSQTSVHLGASKLIVAFLEKWSFFRGHLYNLKMVVDRQASICEYRPSFGFTFQSNFGHKNTNRND